MAFVEDLAPFFNEFAESATWQTVQIKVIYDNAYLQSFEMAGTEPIAWAKQAEMPGVKKGQNIVIRGINYLICQPPEPDGNGLIKLLLQKP